MGEAEQREGADPEASDLQENPAGPVGQPHERGDHLGEDVAGLSHALQGRTARREAARTLAPGEQGPAGAPGPEQRKGTRKRSINVDVLARSVNIGRDVGVGSR